MISFNKADIKDALSIDNIFELLQDWGGDPEYAPFGILCSTICHNEPGIGSRKLYYYENSNLFKCYTGCDTYFDIFELFIKIAKIQQGRDLDLNDAIRWIAKRFNIAGTFEEDEEDQSEDWNCLANYERIQEINIKENQSIILKNYDLSILDKFNYKIKLSPWLDEGISQEVLNKSLIGYYPTDSQITIPHFDENNRFVGLRGRALAQEDIDRFGKYRPIKVGFQLYNHPLGMNLYNLNKSKENISKVKKAIIFEGEKSCLKYQTYFGFENDITVACCGSSVSNYHIQLLQKYGVEEIIIAFDRQFKEIGDTEFQHLKNNLMKLYNKYKNSINITFMFDKNMITDYKSSPIDCGKDIFLQLFSERIIL